MAQTVRTSRFLKYLRFLKLLRLLRVARATKIIRSLEKVAIYWYTTTAVRIGQLLLGFLLICHCEACIWRKFSEFDQHAADYGISHGDVESMRDLMGQYTLALFWTITITTSTESPFDPRSRTEMLLSSLGSLISLSCLGFGLGFFLKQLDTLSEASKDFDRKIRVATRFLLHHRVPETLKTKVLGAVRTAQNLEWHRGEFKSMVEPLLSEDIRHELFGNIHDDLLARFPPFRQGDSSVMRNFRYKLAYDATERVYDMGSIIIQEGKEGDTMIFIVDGLATLFSERQQIELSEVPPNWWLGEKVLFWTGNDKPKRAASVTALQACRTLEITVTDFLEAVREFHLQSWLERLRHNLEDGTPWGCPACAQHDHWFSDCPLRVVTTLQPSASKPTKDNRMTRIKLDAPGSQLFQSQVATASQPLSQLPTGVQTGVPSQVATASLPLSRAGVPTGVTKNASDQKPLAANSSAPMVSLTVCAEASAESAFRLQGTLSAPAAISVSTDSTPVGDAPDEARTHAEQTPAEARKEVTLAEVLEEIRAARHDIGDRVATLERRVQLLGMKAPLRL